MNVSVPRCGSTWLITPASAADWLDTARSAGADVALLDLEDSVPHHRKNAARAAAIGCLTEAADGGTTVLGLRLNSPCTVHGLRDLVAVAESGLRPAVLLVPKVESARATVRATSGLTTANLALDELRLENPVYIGDTLRAETEILTARPSKSRPECGVVTCRTTGYNQLLPGLLSRATTYAHAAACPEARAHHHRLMVDKSRPADVTGSGGGRWLSSGVVSTMAGCGWRATSRTGWRHGPRDPGMRV